MKAIVLTHELVLLVMCMPAQIDKSLIMNMNNESQVIVPDQREESSLLIEMNMLDNYVNDYSKTYIVSLSNEYQDYNADVVSNKTYALNLGLTEGAASSYPIKKPIIFKWEKSYLMNAVRIGEYYWMDNNFNWTSNDPWNSTLFPAITQAYLDKYMSYILVDKSKYQVNLNDFNKYYGLYVNHAGMFEVSKFGRILENNVVNSSWKLPNYSDVRQLFAMSPFHPEGSYNHDVLNERDIRFTLSPKGGDNPMAFNFADNAKPWYHVYWFDNVNVTNKYGFNLMPAGFRFVANNIPWTNGLGKWTANRGDIALLFYTAYFPVTNDNSTSPYKMNGLVVLHDSIDYIPFTSAVDNRYPFRWCRKLTDAELGYKLYVKANSPQWSSVAALVPSQGETPILKELINNRILPQDISIIKTALNAPIPAGYVELPKGYIRGFYVQYFIDNPNSQRTIENIITYALKVQDNYVRKLRDAPALKSTKVGQVALSFDQVSATLHIKAADKGVIISKLRVYELSGRLALDMDDVEERSVDLNHLSSGLYIIQAVLNGTTYTQKILKR